MEFFMAMNPPTVTQQMHKVGVGKSGKPYVYEPAELQTARRKLMAHLAPNAPKSPAKGPVMLVAKWCFPRGDKHQDGEWKITKPDTDNLQKLLKDCMTDLHFWRDDAQVCSEICEKFWAEIPGIYIQVLDLYKGGPWENLDARGGMGYA